MKNIIDRPAFLISDALKIAHLKEGDYLDDIANFTQVKSEFLLELHDRVVYLGNKKYVIPIYEITISPEPEVGDIYYDSSEREYCEVIEVNRNTGSSDSVKVKFERKYSLSRFYSNFKFVRKSRAIALKRSLV